MANSSKSKANFDPVFTETAHIILIARLINYFSDRIMQCCIYDFTEYPFYNFIEIFQTPIEEILL